MSNPRMARQRPLFYEGPDWCQFDGDVRVQLVERLAALCLEILNEHTPDQPENDQEQRRDCAED